MTSTNLIAPTLPSSLYRQLEVLAILPGDEQAALRRLFGHTNWSLRCCTTLADALAELRRRPATVVITGKQISGGNWQDVVLAAAGLPGSPQVLVAGSEKDYPLWEEVPARGAYAVLTSPFTQGEVCELVHLAWLHWYDKAGHKAATE